MNEETRYPDENWQPQTPGEAVAIHLYDAITSNARHYPELMVMPLEMEAVASGLEAAGWEKNPDHEDNKDPHCDHNTYQRTFYVNGEWYICEAWLSETKLHLHQNGFYGVIGVFVADLQEGPPFAIETAKMIETAITLATKELIMYGVPMGDFDDQGIEDPDGSLAATNQMARDKYGLDKAEKRDMVP